MNDSVKAFLNASRKGRIAVAEYLTMAFQTRFNVDDPAVSAVITQLGGLSLLQENMLLQRCEGRTLTEIGEQHNVTRARVKKLCDQGLEKISTIYGLE
jgi:DNA-binding CsgD family transcriptional regulator